MIPGWRCGQIKSIMSNTPDLRKKIFQKIVDLKKTQKEKLQKIRSQMKQLERQNLSTTGFTKLTSKSIKLIQTQRRANIILIKSDCQKLEEISNQLTSLELDYLKLSSSKKLI